MKRTTKKLAGKPLEQFLKRFFLSQPEIDAKTAEALTRAGRDAFSSVRVNALSLARCRRPKPTASTNSSAGTATARSGTAIAAPAQKSSPQQANAPQPTTGDGANSETTPFDPYAIGLVPTFQREGADGLMTRLSEVTSPDHLRKMARAQQVALPSELRKDGANAGAIREAIVKAVAKRIADRRAAAG